MSVHLEFEEASPTQQITDKFYSWIVVEAWFSGTEEAISSSAVALEMEIHKLHASRQLDETVDRLKSLVKPVVHGGDHHHWVLFQNGPERRSSLVTFSEIGQNSDPNVNGHVHEDEKGHQWIEMVLPLEKGLVIKDEKTGEVSRLEPFKTFTIGAGMHHVTYNESEQKVRYFILRRRLIPHVPSVFARKNGINHA